MDKEKIKKAIKELLESVGENPNSPNLRRTPERVANLYEELFSGKGACLKNILQVNHSLKHDEMVLIKNIPFYSMCEHELLPFFGECHIAYIPENNRVVGIGRIAKAVDVMSKRLQIQERLTTEIANALMQHLKPKGAGVVIEAKHLCLEMEGLNRPGTKIVTSALRGLFRADIKTREEFLKLIK